jgi:phosphoribosylamine-glycine ligase
MNAVAESLRGQHLLIVEDEYFLAQDLTDYFQQLGVKVVGPSEAFRKRWSC